MATSVIPVRLPEGLVKEIDELIETGDYSSRSDVIKDAVRKLVWKGSWENTWKDAIGSIPNTGDSVKEIRELRKKLSNKSINVKELNKL